MPDLVTLEPIHRLAEPELVPAPPGRALAGDLVRLPGGTFRMGSDRHYPEEAPSREVTVGAFWMDRSPVTNARFAEFVLATRYVTVAERERDPADHPGADPRVLQPGGLVFRQPTGRLDPTGEPTWWHYVPGADWRHPTGPDSSIAGMGAHPVVQVAHEDALAYAAWAGEELPTEAEWEFAARGGLEGREFAWGDELHPGGRIMANVWHGVFPRENLLEDGYERTSPVGIFPPNGYGILDLIGNVWEWTADWWSVHVQVACRLGSLLPEIDEREASRDPLQPELRTPRKVLKGGSYLSAQNYCMRYRPAARMAQRVDTASCHQGFRCVVRHPASG